MNDTSPTHIHIFCDGGIGNRINALISGLAIARHFGLAYRVYWPTNNWCSAAFSDIFQNIEPVCELSLSDLKGKMDGARMLLHDAIASECLGVEFASAYAFESMEDFKGRALHDGRPLFFYPALMPEWVPAVLVHEALKGLAFTDHIQRQTSGFIRETLVKPFYGLHLRRTDLKVGLTDEEVLHLVSGNREAVFYVCSDDPVAEALASAHPHVHSRSKEHYVEKKIKGGEWTAACADDDGRMYHGNIQRGRESVIEATIDMLILAHSEIVGYSGSTFQRMARLIGEVNPLVHLERPAPLTFFSNSEIKRQLEARALPLDTFLHICNAIGTAGRVEQAIELLRAAAGYFEGPELLTVLHSLAVFCLNRGQAQLAHIYLKHVVTADPGRASSWLHLALAGVLLNNATLAAESMRLFRSSAQNGVSANDQALFDFLQPRIPTG
jgi:hypothetical protein